MESLRLVTREELVEQGIRPEGRSSLSWFALRLPSSYGPVILLSTCWALVRIARRRPRPETVDICLILFLMIGLTGVLLVNPHPQYTAPLLFGLVYLSARHIVDVLGDAQTIKLSAICFLFVVCQLLATTLP